MSNEDSEKDSNRANELNLEGYVAERSIILNPVFKNGYSVGWHFCIREAFRDALDIRLTPRSFGGQKINVLTQGCGFDFKKGDMIHDTKKAYDLPWGEALKYLGYTIQIDEAIPSSFETTKVYKTVSPVKYLEDEREKNVEKVITYRRTRLSAGYVKFTLYKPNMQERKVEPFKTIETDQELFVSFLQSGIVRTNTGETIKIEHAPDIES